MADDGGAAGVVLLPPATPSLARGVPRARPGTLFVLGPAGGVQVGPDASMTIVVGRNEPEVHVCVGGGDPNISRRHGLLGRAHGRWTLRNTGRLPIQLPGSQLLLSGHDELLPTSYTPVFIRQHLLEIRVTGTAPGTGTVDASAHEVETREPRVWPLSERERLVLVSLGQRYLRHEARPQPTTFAEVAAELAELQPGACWTRRVVDNLVTRLRARLARDRVRGLVRAEVEEPVGNTLNHNLLVELLTTTTLVPPDLRCLDPGAEDGRGAG